MTSRAPRPLAGPAAAWWIKCDPTSDVHGGWDWPDLFREYREGVPFPWSVGTALSQKNARLARPGDAVFGYAAGEGHRELSALAQVEQGSLFVPGARPPSRGSGLPGGFTVSLRPLALLPHPLPLAAVRHALRHHEPEFFRTRFGSIFKVGPREFEALMEAVCSANPALRLPPAWRPGATARRPPATQKPRGRRPHVS